MHSSLLLYDNYIDVLGEDTHVVLYYLITTLCTQFNRNNITIIFGPVNCYWNKARKLVYMQMAGQRLIFLTIVFRPAKSHGFKTHDFNFKLKVSQVVPLISRFLATLANSQVFSMETHSFDYTEGAISWFLS